MYSLVKQTCRDDLPTSLCYMRKRKKKKPPKLPYSQSPCNFVFFQYMKFIVKLVSIQHPVLIPKGALLNTHHPPPLPPTPHQPSVCSQFLRVFYALVLSHSNLFFFSFPSPMGFCEVSQDPHKSENIWYLSFSVWLISLSITLSSSIHVATKSHISFFLIATQYSIV